MNCCDCTPQCAPHVSLDEWREIMCYNPYYFWQLAQSKLEHPDTPIPDNTTVCNPLSYKKGWQAGTVGRDEVWRALIRAEEQFAEFACYYPFPTYSCYEKVFLRTKLTHCWGKPLRFQLPMRKIQEIGKEAHTLIRADVPIDAATEFFDRDGDGVLDWVEIRIPNIDTDVDELQLYFSEEDWCDKPLCKNEIRPLCIERDGDDIIVTGHSWLFVRPILYGNQATAALDPADLDIYPTEIDLYRRWTDTDNAVRLMQRAGHCKCETTDECYTMDAADLCIVDAERGIVELHIPNDCCACPECVDKICVDYLSGDCGNEALISRLAAANLGRQVCCCENDEVKYWMMDFISLDNKGRISTALPVAEQSNQFGTRRGQLEAYRWLKPRRPAKLVQI